jgi:hypothetical protein
VKPRAGLDSVEKSGKLNFKIGVRGTAYENVKWAELFISRVQWQALVMTALKCKVLQQQRISSPAE